MRAKRIVVAQRSRVCRVCKLTPEQIARVNAAIWPEPGVSLRAANYRIAAIRVAATFGLDVEEKSITRHARHIEATWHRVGHDTPPAPGEIPVFSTDYQSVTGMAAQIGAHAMDVLGRRIGALDAPDLIAVAKLGVTAATKREELRIKQAEVETAQGLMGAIFGLVGGHVSEADVPETEIIDVTPVEVLHDEVQAEREALKRLQAGEAVGAR